MTMISSFKKRGHRKALADLWAGMLLELEHSRGQAAGHLLSGAITMDCNMKLFRHHTFLPSLSLPQALAMEAYQLPFDPPGRACLMGLCQLMEKAGEVASQQRQ